MFDLWYPPIIPKLRPQEVASIIVDCLANGGPEEIWIPALLVYAGAIARLFPTALVDWIATVCFRLDSLYGRDDLSTSGFRDNRLDGELQRPRIEL